MNYLKKHSTIFITLLIIIVIGILSLIAYFNNDLNNTNEVVSISLSDETTTTEEVVESEFFVDIKGAVKNPGVYKVNSNNIVNDVIKMAGGTKSNAYTNNINLSQKVFSEMVIYIFTKNEITTTVSNVITDTKCTTNIIKIEPTTSTTTTITNKTELIETTTVNKLININTASKEELMTLTGIGSSKADAIIIYRTDNLFKVIEDIMNVSGIGESAFDKIKDFITV